MGLFQDRSLRSFKGDSCVVARKAEPTSLLQMVIIVVVVAADCGLIIMYSLLSFIYHFECVTYILLIYCSQQP